MSPPLRRGPSGLWEDGTHVPPIRSCIACRTEASPGELLRLVADAQGVVHPDLSAKLPGRGAWVHPSPACIDTLLKRPRIVSRALRCEASLDGLDERIHRGTLGRLLQRLSVAARAGCIVGGHDQILQQVARGQVLAFVSAADASRRSIEALCAAAPGLPEYSIELSKEALGGHVGKGPRAALGVRVGSPARALLDELRRYTALGYPPRRNRSGDRPQATRQAGTTQSRGRGLDSPSSPVSSRSKRGQPTGASLREGSVCPRKRS